MAHFRFANRASALVTASVSSTDVIIHIETGGGALFPAPAAGEAARATLISSTGSVEIIDITNISGDTLTVERAKEGTAARSFASGSRIEQRVTAGILNNFIQKTGDQMTGVLDMNNNQIINPAFGTHVPFTNIGVKLIRAFDVLPATVYSPAECSIVFPGANAGPRIFNKPVIHSGMLESLIFAAWIDVHNVPPHLKLCDGTNGTPDLRGLFIKGATPGVEDVGLTHVGNIYTSSAGKHSHGGATGLTDLNSGNLPPIANTLGTVRDIQAGGDFLRVQTVASNYSGSAQHAHGIAEVDDHIHFVDVQPSYFCMAWVMFKSDL